MTTAELRDAGRLLSFGLQPKSLPGRDAEYAALIARFRSEPTFSDSVLAIAEGQGLAVLGCDRIAGLVVVPVSDSPYRLRLQDYTAGSVEERLLHGLVHLAIAATCFPTAASLEDEAAPLPSVSATDIQERVERLARSLSERFGRTDPPVDHPELEPVWRLILRTRATDTTTDRRSTSHTTLGMIKKALKFLADQGLADPVPRAAEPDTYRMRLRYRLHVLDAASAALTLARQALGQAAPTIDTVGPTASPSGGGHR